MSLAMINTQLLLTFAVTVAVIVAIPGPSVLFIIGRALSVGRPAALAAAVGNTLGSTVQGVGAAFGLGALVGESATAYTLIKTGGALYLVVLGTSTLRHRKASAPGDVSTGASPVANDSRRHVRQGFVVGLTNPKTLVFLSAALPQFIDPARGHVVVQMLVLLSVYSFLSLAGDTSWGFAGGLIRGWSANSPRRIERIIGGGGACIIAVGLALVLAD